MSNKPEYDYTKKGDTPTSIPELEIDEQSRAPIADVGNVHMTMDGGGNMVITIHAPRPVPESLRQEVVEGLVEIQEWLVMSRDANTNMVRSDVVLGMVMDLIARVEKGEG